MTTKVKMYRGIDSYDDTDTMFAVLEGTREVAVCPAHEGHWMTPESFEDPRLWAFVSRDIFDHVDACIEKASLVWEAEFKD